MTPRQIELVRATFAEIAPRAPDAAALFYGRLFEVAPQLRALFRGDLTAQGGKLMQALAATVGGLERIDELAPALRELGRRHRGYGVADSHYEIVGGALLWTLGQGLGGKFTDEVRDAWATAYGLVADTMKAGAALRTAA